MKIFLVKRDDEINYEEFDSYVVIAENEADAIKQCCNPQFKFANTVVSEVIPTKSNQGVVLGSFNAG